MDVLLNDLSAECSLAERGVAADAVDWRLLWLMGEEGEGRGEGEEMECGWKSCWPTTLFAGSPTAA